jgi:hypothetical protein
MQTQKKLAAQVAELRALPDNKRCWDCETLGTTYYVPQLSIFVCMQCSGVHMQFGHRVKSVTLADFSADEVEAMRQGGNQARAQAWRAAAGRGACGVRRGVCLRALRADTCLSWL